MTIRGRVTSASGEPLGKAEVTLSSMRFEDRLQYVAATAADGRYRIDGVDPGQYQLTAGRAGYVRAAYGGKLETMGVPLTVAPDRALGDFDFALLPQAVVTGRVLDPDGDPMENVRVSLAREMTINGVPRLNAAGGQAVTNDLGEFRIAGVAPGNYVLSASYDAMRHQHVRRIVRGPEESYPTLYYPDAADSDEAQWVNVPAGAALTGFELRMKRVPAFRVSGRVELPSGANRMSVGVNLLPILRGGAGFAGSGGQHGSKEFLFDSVRPGKHMLTAHCSLGNRSVQTRAEVEVLDRDIAGIVLRFPSGMTIQGVVRGEGALEGIHITLFDAARNPGPQATTQPDVTFSLYDVAPGRYHIGAFRYPRDAYLKTVRYDGVDVPPGEVEIDHAAPLELELAYDSGVVAGVVPGAPGVPVMIRAGDDLRHGTITDQDGRFEIRGVVPGKYVVAAPNASAPVTVAPRARVEVTLE